MRNKRVIKSKKATAEIEKLIAELNKNMLSQAAKYEGWQVIEELGDSAAFKVCGRIIEMSLKMVDGGNILWKVFEGAVELGGGITSTCEQGRREAEKFARRQFINIV